MGSVVTTIFFAEVATYYDEAKDKHPQGAHHRRLRQLRWWPLPELPTAPAGGPPSTSSSTTMVAAAGAPDSTRRGPAIDVFINYDGGHCRSSRQHPQGARCLHYEEAPEQSYRWLHPHEHLIEVSEDRHQCDGVGGKVLQLEPVKLQQREEKRRQRRHQPGQGVRREEDEIPWLQVGQRHDPVLQPVLKARCLPPHQSSQAGKRARRPEPRRQKLSGHGGLAVVASREEGERRGRARGERDMHKMEGE
jgi:hypothetical protein